MLSNLKENTKAYFSRKIFTVVQTLTKYFIKPRKAGRFLFRSKKVSINKQQLLENIWENFKIPQKNSQNKLSLSVKGHVSYREFVKYIFIINSLS